MLKAGYFVQVYIAYLVYIVNYLINKKGNSKNAISGKCLINKPEGSYRIAGHEHKDLLIILKYAYRLVLKWSNQKKYTPHVEEHNGIALYDEATDWEPRLDFIASVYKNRPGIFIDKEQISTSKINHFELGLKTILLAIMVLPLLPFSLTKNRAQAGLLLHEVDELSQLIVYLNKLKINTLIYSCIFEKDSNAAANYIMRRGIKIVKNPSEDPLYFNNSMIIANELGICNPYQLDEIKAYKETMHINNTLNWYPENHLIHLKNNNYTQPQKGVIGYYSGSSWLRIELNYNLVTGAFDPYTAEAECEKALAEFMQTNPNYILRVFLHPLEKKHLDLTQAHFAKVWPNVKFEFEEFEKHTTATFNRCDVAVTVFSGVMFYRYYAGYKGLMYCPYMPGFPLPNSLLSKVSATTIAELKEKLQKAMQIDCKEFAENQLLGKFRYEA